MDYNDFRSVGNIKLLFNSPNDPTKLQERDLLSHLLQLSLNCLLFDFIGTTSNDDTSDDLSTVQIPTTWRSSKLNFFRYIL